MHDAGNRAQHLAQVPPGRRAHIVAHRRYVPVLAIRREEERRDLVFHAVVLRVLHQPHDLDLENRRVAQPHVLADDVASQTELPREGLVDHCHLRCAQLVSRGELAPLEQRHPQRPEIAWPHLIEA